MKFIRKGRKPAALSKFERENVATPHVLTYDALPGPIKRLLSAKMLREQGRLCAYTMRRIGASDATGGADFHIEHIRPQSLYPKRQLDYRNIVLCASGPLNCEWGARCKANTDVDESNFVSPLRRDCETRLFYRPDGAVRAMNETDLAAKATVELLNLNHRELVSERIAALRSFGLYEDSATPLGGKSVRRLRGNAAERLSEGICKLGADGDFAPFCVAIRQAAERLARKTRQRAARLAARQDR